MKKALFVCIGNAGRSQMAQALYERLGGEARSAGSRPEQELHEAVVEAMEEVGIDISDRHPKGFTDDDVRVGGRRRDDGLRRRLPRLPGQEYVDWNLPTPSACASRRCGSCATTSKRRVAPSSPPRSARRRRA
jgi:arsenate reductase